MLLFLTTLLSLATLTLAAPAATPSNPTPTITAKPTVQARCEGGDCEYGGTATTLTPSVVTTTVLSVTSVPCYITTYVTDSTTTTSTVYSTDTVTSTVTKEGTVSIIKYQPTPIIKSSEYTSVIEITQTGTTMWTEDQGSAYEETITGDTRTIDGTVAGGGEYKNTHTVKGDYNTNTNTDGKGGGDGAAASAWTHATAQNDKAGATTIAAGNAANVGAGTAADGWAGAVGGTGANANANANAITATTAANGVSVNWNASCRVVEDVPSFLIVSVALFVVAFFELSRFMA